MNLRLLIATLLFSQLIAFGAETELADPDFANTPLPKLTLPPEPPGRLRLPDPIVKADEWRGVQCGVQEARYAIFRSSDRWNAFWESAMAPYSDRLKKIPAVDFEKHVVVGVFLGEKTTPNFEIEIRRITEVEKDGVKTLLVSYREIKKMQGVFVPPFTIQPFHLKRIPSHASPIIFEKTKR